MLIGGVLLLGALFRGLDIPFDSKQSSSSLSEPRTKIDINEASLGELIKVPTIGEKTALSIIEYRAHHGEFTAVEDLINVKGIGPKKIEIIKEHITF